MDTKGKLTVLSRNRGVFMDAKVENKKRDTPKGCLCKACNSSPDRYYLEK